MFLGIYYILYIYIHNTICLLYIYIYVYHVTYVYDILSYTYHYIRILYTYSYKLLEVHVDSCFVSKDMMTEFALAPTQRQTSL